MLKRICQYKVPKKTQKKLEKVLTEYICQARNEQGDTSPCLYAYLRTQQLESEPHCS